MGISEIPLSDDEDCPDEVADDGPDGWAETSQNEAADDGPDGWAETGLGVGTVDGPGVGAVDGPGVDAVDGPGVDAVDGPGVDAVDGPGVGAVDGPGVGAVDGPDEVTEGPKSRKRKRCEASWKRNIKKEAVAKGRAHVTTGKYNRLVPEKVVPIGVNICGGVKQCKWKKCNTVITDEIRREVHHHFYNELDKNGKRQFLFATQRPFEPKQRKTLDPSKQRSSCFESVLNAGGKEYKICLQALSTLTGYGVSSIKQIRANVIRRGAVGPVPQGSGSHNNHPNCIPLAVRQKVINHIAKFPAESSHYSRHKNPNRKYLSPLLTIAGMHRLFTEQQTDDGDNDTVSLHYYRDTFNSEFNLGFGNPRSDTCCTCSLDGPEKEAHVERANFANTTMSNDKKMAAGSKSTMFITFDLQKTMPLPKLSESEAFYLRQLWFYNCGVHIVDATTGVAGRGFMFTWTEDEFGRGCSEVASSLLALFENNAIAKASHLVAWSDSCGGQNKNFYIIALWQYLVKIGRFKIIEHKFPEVGHSRLDSDRDFGHIEASIRKHEKIYIPEEYRDIIAGCQRKTPFTIIPINNCCIDVKKLATKLDLVKRTKNTTKEKVQFKDTVRWIKVDNFGEFKYRTSFSDDEPWKVVDILRKRTSASGGDDDVEILQAVAKEPGRQIKAEKFNDIQKQLKYIPRYAQGFYKRLVCQTDNENNDEDDEATA